MHSKSLHELPATTYETAKCNYKWVSSPDLLIFRQFHRHILKNGTMLFPATFISTSEKIGVGLEKQRAIFFFNFTQRWVVQYSCFDFFSSAI